LVRDAFPKHAYVSLENPSQRQMALEDPMGFLSRHPKGVILDEAQRAPDLFSYLQGIVDEDKSAGRFILTGSQNFLLLKTVSQSLAGRCGILHLLPLSNAELESREALDLAEGPQTMPPRRGTSKVGKRDPWSRTIWTGFYPAIRDRRIPPREWLEPYIQTYLERDVRDLVNVGNLETFGRFLRLCAGRSGQLLSLMGLASDCGISQPTARQWLSVLTTSFIVTLVEPYHRNFNKRIIKTPKLYFLDTGLLCNLLRIASPEDLAQHASRGAVFETFVAGELIKNAMNRGVRPALSFWKDKAGREVDFLVEEGKTTWAMEVKSGETAQDDMFTGLRYWDAHHPKGKGVGALVYGGGEAYTHQGFRVIPWNAL
jgi:predicted AAA+ superfamily ATPase